MKKFEVEQAKIQRTKESYPPGTRIMLLSMDDPYAPIPSGTKSTVVHVDDAAQIHMKWDNGRTLAIVPDEDNFRKLTDEELDEENNAICVEERTDEMLDDGQTQSMGM